MESETLQEKLFVIDQQQFGYNIVIYELVKRLIAKFEITLLCWDEELPRKDIDGINIIYIPQNGRKIKSVLRFRLKVIEALRKNRFDKIFTTYYVGVSSIHLFAKKAKRVCFIITGSITSNAVKRILFNSILYLESISFRNRTLLSENMAKSLGFDKFHVLPLGATTKAAGQKNFSELHLLYVGTFNNRHVEKAIIGFSKFTKRYSSLVSCHFTIIGTGYPEAVDAVQTSVKKYHLGDFVSYEGYIHQDDLSPYYEKCNVGISYVPITPFFDSQPPTKTYEYLLSGLAVLATSTKENKRLINDENGVLTGDTPDDFCNGLKQIYDKRELFDSEKIKKSSAMYSWDHIVYKNLVPYLDNLE